MSISSINTTEVLNSLLENTNMNPAKEADTSVIPFADVLQDAVSNVYETDKAVQNDALKIATGETDSLHTLTIDMAKADLAIETLVQVRNKALDVYKEIMNITL